MGIRSVMKPSGVVVVWPEGVLDANAAPALREELLSLAGNGDKSPKEILVDLSGVEIIDSTGLGALIDGLKAMRKNGGDLRIASLSDQVASMVELARLGGILKIADPSDAATE